MSDRDPVSYEELSRVRNPNTDYVTVILDAWKGDRDDPAVGVTRFLALYKAEEVPETFVFSDNYYGYRLRDAQRPLHWTELGQQKQAVREAQQHKSQYESMTDPGKYAGYGVYSSQKEKYTALMDAIDKLHEDPEDSEAWKKVDNWRSHMATLYEK